MSKAKYYISSFRLRTLPLSLSGIFLGTLLAKADVINKTISAVGIITSYNGEIQLHVFKLSDLEIA